MCFCEALEWLLVGQLSDPMLAQHEQLSSRIWSVQRRIEHC